jgi:hypothetical protein
MWWRTQERSDRTPDAGSAARAHDPAGSLRRFVLANDLGLDKTFIYRLDANGKLPASDPNSLQRLPGPDRGTSPSTRTDVSVCAQRTQFDIAVIRVELEYGVGTGGPVHIDTARRVRGR